MGLSSSRGAGKQHEMNKWMDNEFVNEVGALQEGRAPAITTHKPNQSSPAINHSFHFFPFVFDLPFFGFGCVDGRRGLLMLHCRVCSIDSITFHQFHNSLSFRPYFYYIITIICFILLTYCYNTFISIPSNKSLHSLFAEMKIKKIYLLFWMKQMKNGMICGCRPLHWNSKNFKLRGCWLYVFSPSSTQSILLFASFFNQSISKRNKQEE